MKKITLVTDGACLGNPGPGGWAALLRFGEHEKLLTGNEPITTNNRMEISAVLFGLKSLQESCDVHVVTDSRYVMDAFEKGWLAGWQRNGWRTASKKPVKNQELWQELAAAVKRHQVRWTWVKGHAGHPENELVDEAARKAAQEAQR